MAEKTDGIIAYAKQKNRETIDKVNHAIDSLKRSKTQTVNFATVAKKAGVSRATLYNNPVLKERIQSLGAANKKNNRENVIIPKDKLKLQGEKISILRQEINQLKSDKQKLILQLIDMDALRRENDRLKRKEGTMATMKMRTATDLELRNMLRDEINKLAEYEEMFDCMAAEEKDELREWMAHGKSVTGNPYMLCGENGRLMDLIAARRVADEMAAYPERFQYPDVRKDESENMLSDESSL
jgi:hypothetical protein